MRRFMILGLLLLLAALTSLTYISYYPPGPASQNATTPSPTSGSPTTSAPLLTWTPTTPISPATLTHTPTTSITEAPQTTSPLRIACATFGDVLSVIVYAREATDELLSELSKYGIVIKGARWQAGNVTAIGMFVYLSRLEALREIKSVKGVEGVAVPLVVQVEGNAADYIEALSRYGNVTGVSNPDFPPQHIDLQIDADKFSFSLIEELCSIRGVVEIRSAEFLITADVTSFIPPEHYLDARRPETAWHLWFTDITLVWKIYRNYYSDAAFGRNSKI